MISTKIANFAAPKRPDGGMVDTRDLKSLGHYGCAGSSPARGTLTAPRNILNDIPRSSFYVSFYDLPIILHKNLEIAQKYIYFAHENTTTPIKMHINRNA